MSPAPIVFEVPDLGTDRLRLRAWRVGDAAALVEAWNDPAIADGSTPPADRSLGAAARWIAGCDERRIAGVAFDLAVVGADDRVVGEVGLASLDPLRRAAMIGWWVQAAQRGSGVATGAVTLLTDWVLQGRLRMLVAEIGAENAASITVAERAGYRQIADPRNPQGNRRGTGARVWYVANSTVK